MSGLKSMFWRRERQEPPPFTDRLFGKAGDILTPKRREMTGQALAQLLSLKRWQRERLITRDENLFERAIAAIDRSALQPTQTFARDEVAGEGLRTVACQDLAGSGQPCKQASRQSSPT